MPYEFRFRRGVASTWAARNPILGPGEPGLETDTGKYKIGDGLKTWAQLSYFLDANGVEALIDDAAVEGPPGPDGKSAYEVAVDNGYSGSESQWLASLVGPAGSNGTNGLDGSDGDDGIDGTDGLSAYEVAVANGFSGSESAWLASLVGPAGTNGTNGTNGTDGADGESVTVTLVDAADWPPPADSNPLHLYFRVP